MGEKKWLTVGSFVKFKDGRNLFLLFKKNFLRLLHLIVRTAATMARRVKRADDEDTIRRVNTYDEMEKDEVDACTFVLPFHR